MWRMFLRCENLKTINVENFNTERVINMGLMFAQCLSLKSLDLSSFKNKSASTREMFSGCPLLTKIYANDEFLPYDSFNMFFDCFNLEGSQGTIYDPAHVDGSYAHIDGGDSSPGYFSDKNPNSQFEHKVQPYAALSNDNKVLTFYYDNKRIDRDGMCFSKTTTDHLPWGQVKSSILEIIFDKSFSDVNGITNISYWFYSCWNLLKIAGLEYFNSSALTQMTWTFSGCEKMKQFDLSDLNTSNVVDMTGMFSGCNILERIYVDDKWSTGKVTASNYMFYGCEKLVGGKGTVYSADHIDHHYACIDGGSSSPGYLTHINDDSNFEGTTEPTTFTFQTTEGVQMTFVITNEEPKTCAVYSQTIASGTTGTVTIPETANGYSVTGIGKNAFKGCASVTSITIPATIKEIGDSAFFGCSALSEVHSLVLEPFAISDNVFMASDGVFTSATLHVPAGTKAKYETTAGWKQFKSIVENGTTPGDDIDPSKGWLTLVDKKLKRLNSAKGEWMMFQSNGYLVKGEEGREYNSLSDAHIDPNDPSVLFFDFNPGTYKKVAFRSDGAVKMLDEKHLSEMVPEGTYTIADGTDCYDHIGDNTFRVKTDEGVLMRFKVIDEENNTCQVFTISEQGERMGWAWTTSISDQTTGIVTIPSVANSYTVTEIGEYAFWPCSQVTTFIVPETVTTIGKEAFRGCTSIADFYIYATTVPSTDRIFEYVENNLTKGYATIPSATLHVPAGTKEAYAAVEPWSAFGKIVVIGEEEADVVTVDEVMYVIGDDGTAALTGLQSGLSGEVVIPEVITVDGNTYPVTEIAAGAFRDCQQMTSVVIPAGVTVIGEGAFAGCSGLMVIICNNPVPADLGQANARMLGGTKTGMSGVPSQFEGVDVSACVLYVPEGSVDLYRNTPGWSCFLKVEAFSPDGIATTMYKADTPTPWHMLNGSRMASKPTHKGIYIHHGRKYVIK